MEFHLPKPFHGWREFLKEYGVVVLGVITALAAEQLVESLHWRRQVAEGRRSIREELDADAFSATERVLLSNCFEQRLSYLQAKLASAADWWAPQDWRAKASDSASPGDPYGVPIRSWNTEVWRALAADGTAEHLPRTEMLRLSSLYYFIDRLGSRNAREWDELAPVSMLGVRFRLTDVARYQTQLALQQQQNFNRLATLGSAQVLGRMRDSRMLPSGRSWDRRIADVRRRAAACEREVAQARATLRP